MKVSVDGWRAVVDETFTDANVARIAHAFIRSRSEKSGGLREAIAIAYDGRRSSRHAASLFADVASSYGLHVFLSNAIVPTPVVSFAARHRSCSAGVMVTAGHDAPSSNGIKFFSASGVPLMPDDIRIIEASIQPEAERYTPMADCIERSDFLPAYIAHLHTLVDVDRLRTFGEDPRNHAAVIIDSMGGAGQTLIEDLLIPCGWRAQTIFGTADPDFYGRLPEPVSHNLEPLKYNVRTTDTLFGIATDGDAGSCGIVCGDGEWVNARETALARAWHLREHKHWPSEDTEHRPESDGILSGLLFAEMIAVSGRTLREIIDDIRAHL